MLAGVGMIGGYTAGVQRPEGHYLVGRAIANTDEPPGRAVALVYLAQVADEGRGGKGFKIDSSWASTLSTIMAPMLALWQTLASHREWRRGCLAVRIAVEITVAGLQGTGDHTMYTSPLTPPDPKFAKADAERQTELLRSGAPTDALSALVWGLTKFILSVLVLPVRLSIFWWLKQRRKRRQQGSPPL